MPNNLKFFEKIGKGKESLEKTNLKSKPQEISDENMENVSGGYVFVENQGGKHHYYVHDNWNGRKVSVPGLSNGDCVFYDLAKTVDEVWHGLSWEKQDHLRSEGW